VPEKKTVERARRAKRQGKSASTQAGEFVREEMHHIREGKHGAQSPEQAIAIGLSKARRAGVDLTPPREGEASERTRATAKRDRKVGRRGTKKRPATKRSRSAKRALKQAGRNAASTRALSKHARRSARKRTATERSAAAKKAVRTKGAAERSRAAKKAARTKGATGRSQAARKAARTRARRG
jgi:hypothetical protein